MTYIAHKIDSRCMRRTCSAAHATAHGKVASAGTASVVAAVQRRPARRDNVAVEHRLAEAAVDDVVHAAQPQLELVPA